MALEPTSWIGLIENENGLENETGFFLAIVDGVPSLICSTIEDDFVLPLVDLFQNPIMPVALLDPDTGKLLPSQYPDVVLGKTFEPNTIAEMILLSGAKKGDVAIVSDIPGGASYRLMGDNYNNLAHWRQLVARNQSWNEILNKPRQYPPTPHEHDEYPLLVNGKIPVNYISAFPMGRRFITETLDDMTGISATPGDVCRVQETKGTYILLGSPYNIDDWIRLIPPDGTVSSVQGQTEDVWLRASDIGALSDTTRAEDIGGLPNTTRAEDIGGLPNTTQAEDIGAADRQHVHISIKSMEGNDVKFSQKGDNLFYSINGGEFLPFA